MNIGKNNVNLNGLSFSGHKKTTDKAGFDSHDFFYLYDVNKYKCEVEFYNIQKDKLGNISIQSPNGKPAEVVAMQEDSRIGGGQVSVNPKKLYNLTLKEGFAYRYKLTEKNNSKAVSYAFDNGSVIGILDDLNNSANKYNVVLNNRATINKNGAMQLIMPDEYYPGVIKGEDGKPTVDQALRNQALASVRTHANKLGGKFDGIIQRLDEISNEGITRIVGTPFTRDTISSHLYWTENAYQTAPTLGSEEDFKQLQTELFKHGINWIADAALVNEGFGGIHLSERLRKGNDAVSKDMFRAGEKISLHILPENLGRTKLKIINPPFAIADDGSFVANNSSYRADRPTYIQFYDDELASDEQKKSTSPLEMTTYANKNTSNIYDITKHDDAVYPFAVEVNPNELARNVKELIASAGKNGVDFANLDMEELKRISDFSTFNIESKSAPASGLEVWDGNVDIAKLNFYPSDKDNARFEELPEEEKQEAIADFNRGALAVRDYAINSGKFWTKLTADTQFAYASNLLSNHNTKGLDANGYKKLIDKLADNGELPKIAKEKIDEETIQNVLSDCYNFRRLDSMDMREKPNSTIEGNQYSVSDYILRQSMDLPLETLPVATNLLGILTSPYLAKRANTDSELGVSRFDLTEAGNPNLPEKYSKTYNQMDDIYKNQIVPLISDILGNNASLYDGNHVSEYGKYIISEVVPDLTKYIIVKALNNNADIRIDEKGNFDFSKVNPEDITMQSIGIPYSGLTSAQEAQTAIDVLKQGIAKVSAEEKNELHHRIEGRLTSRSLKDFKMAEMIMDKTESGMGWRIDAAKDIAPMDSVRSKVDKMDDQKEYEKKIGAWDKVIDFWKDYNQAVLKINPHAYTTAEITDLSDLFGLQDKKIKYTGDGDAERKFLNATGITSIANYNFLFSKLPDLFAPLLLEDFDDANGWQASQEMNHELIGKLTRGWGDIPGFLFQSPDDGVVNSYTFVGNHDKPRMLHLLGLDQKLLHTDFNTEGLNPEAAESVNSRLDAEIERIKNSALKDDLKNKKIEDLNSKKKDVNGIRNELNLKTMHRKIAAKVLYPTHTDAQINSDIKTIDYDKVSSYAVTMGARINQAIDDIVSDDNDKTSDLIKNKLKNIAPSLKTAVSELAKGQYKGKEFDSSAFGTRPFEIAIRSVFDQVNYDNPRSPISEADRKKLEPVILQSILEPAYDRFYSIYKLLVALPGSPTDFAGDRVGVSGYESKAKNYHQQNRNIIHWEWLNDDRYEFIQNAYNTMNEIANLRKRPELSALNDGSTIVMPIENPSDDNKYKYQTLIRYNNESVVLVISDSTGANTPLNKMMDRKTEGKYGITEKIDEEKVKKTGAIDLTPILNTDENVDKDKRRNAKDGLKHGITPGTKFKNAREDDTSVYTIKQNKDNKYYLERTLNGQVKPVVIDEKDLNTLILYKVNE